MLRQRVARSSGVLALTMPRRAAHQHQQQQQQQQPHQQQQQQYQRVERVSAQQPQHQAQMSHTVQELLAATSDPYRKYRHADDIVKTQNVQRGEHYARLAAQVQERSQGRWQRLFLTIAIFAGVMAVASLVDDQLKTRGPKGANERAAKGNVEENSDRWDGKTDDARVRQGKVDRDDDEDEGDDDSVLAEDDPADMDAEEREELARKKARGQPIL